jgi:hypothetical protein
MKAILAVVTQALVALIVEEKARQIAGDTHDAYGEMVDQLRGVAETLSKKIEQKPLIALLIAGSVNGGDKLCQIDAVAVQSCQHRLGQVGRGIKTCSVGDRRQAGCVQGLSPAGLIGKTIVMPSPGTAH